MSTSATAATLLGGFGLILFAVTAALSFALLLLLRPLLRRYALAHPNARSSHKLPTPQGGGIGVIAAMAATVTGATIWLGGIDDRSLWLVLAAAIFIALVGAVDDIRPIPVLPRLLLQAAAVAAVLAALPNELRIVPALPFWLERAALAFAMLWFVNLVNFMDGIDWMTVAETVPVTAGLAVLGGFGAMSSSGMLVALALGGAVIGFAPFNRPVANLFLGDVGSLAIGLLLAWLLADLAGHGHLVAALLLPLYYLADATITLFRRIARREAIWAAHRGHFYQAATHRGISVMAVVGRVFAVNIALAALAVVSVMWNGLAVQLITLLCGAALVACLLVVFETGKGPR